MLVAFALSACSSGNDDQKSAEALACLSYGDEGRVADAAVLAGLASPGTSPGTVRVGGRDESPRVWRSSNPTPFASACAIVVSANKLDAGSSEGASSGGSIWTVLWPLVAGAALTLVTTFATTGWSQRMAEARRHSAALRAAAADYAAEVDLFMAAATNPDQPEPAEGELGARRRKLRQVLDETPRPLRIDAPATAGRLLGDGPIGRDLASGWSGREVRSRTSPRATAVDAAVTQLRSAVVAITTAQERPLRAAARRLLTTTRATPRPRKATI
ncbi:hypothetical protein Asi03nite_30000 [Actinoplanes siamensis]|uniref:Uncharacterized protein n=1 Tax=Actinoplanes siamensis TaxID=1223317 RepID=A0A919N6X3_9ACTN|nr:hypothetical protein Asi03nite_30000 [Actinoplanes siamensis]